MKYRVDFGAEAQDNFYQAARWWARQRSAEQAARWIEQFQAAIEGLQSNPERHPYARENDKFPVSLRELLFGLSGRAQALRCYELVRQTGRLAPCRY